jgi:hypothetical protein
MPFTKADIAVRQLNETDWKLIEPVGYTGNHEDFTVPAGFVTDFASVPRIFFWLLPSYGAYTKAAILHDFLIDTKAVSRADADGLFRRAMRELGVPFIRRWMMWAGVRAASRLVGATPADVARWVLVAVPSVVFLFVPGVVVLVWLSLFWVIEMISFVALKPVSRKHVNRPTFWPSRRRS